jgi:hypothetical protein
MENDEPRDLRAQRAQFLPERISRDEGNTKVSGGIGDGYNKGGSAYYIETGDEAEPS